jgi:DNA-binding CsgD family transcriptional regulator
LVQLNGPWRGKTNKQVAIVLGATERTIKAHRHRIAVAP